MTNRAEALELLRPMLDRWWELLDDEDRTHLASCVILGGVADARARRLLESAPIWAVRIQPLTSDGQPHPSLPEFHIVPPIVSDFIHDETTR